MGDSYSTKEASGITGASTPVIRAYTGVYARYFSTDATPEPGKPRRFTRADLKLIAYVYQKGEREGYTREQVLEQLAAGELDRFAWQAPEEPPSATGSAESAESATSNALVPFERLQAAHALMHDAQRREQMATEQVAALQAEVQRLSLELGKAQGEAAALKTNRYQAPRWWRAIFGGRQGE